MDLGRCLGFGYSFGFVLCLVLGFGVGFGLGFGLSQVDLGGYCLGFGCRCDRPFDHNNHHHSRVDTKVSIMLFATMS